MEYKMLIQKLREAGLFSEDKRELWNDLSELLAAFEALGRKGCAALIKIDGLRTDGAVYTVVLSGGLLGDEFFRKDGNDLSVILSDALAFYLNHINIS